MRDYTSAFQLIPGHCWLNAASEGPLPKVSAEALAQAVIWKSSPHLLTIPKFNQIPIELKQSIARFIHVPADEIILGNSATYGLHLLANGLSFKSGDEIILMQNDFPTDILPWLHLKEKGVIVRQLKASAAVLTAKEIEAAINPMTRLICLPMVHTFSGWPLDIESIGRLCRIRGILCIVNVSQALGALEIDISKLTIDGIVCAGYKWLLGPYGTGFCWLTPALRERLDYPQAYWISLMDERSLNSTKELTLKKDRSSRAYDVFGTANFFNYVPWRASLDYLTEIGINKIQEHNTALVDRLIEGLDKSRYIILSPLEKSLRSNIIVLSHIHSGLNERIFNYLKERGFYLAYWKGNLRVSPHIYNHLGDIGKLLSLLNSYE